MHLYDTDGCSGCGSTKCNCDNRFHDPAAKIDTRARDKYDDIMEEIGRLTCRMSPEKKAELTIKALKSELLTTLTLYYHEYKS